MADEIKMPIDGFRDIFLAGIGALAIGAEKGKEIVDTLVEKGEITVAQGKQINQDLVQKATDVTKGAREAALEARMKAMSPEDREAFAAKAAEIAAKQNAENAAAAEAEAAAEDATEEAAEPAADEGAAE